ncbi:MAG TPA: RsmE family RNA methyltransferase, partial [Opitutales bacterium]|nr:RsmE family RNA methyltransferase [Opitutales bacterium]
EPVSLQSLVSGTLPTARMVCSLEGSPIPFMSALAACDASRGLVLAIGPEGDFSPSEYAALGRAGFVSVTLGPLVLRSDTAATASLAIASELLRFR